jgi:hypothetical protein
MGAQGMDLVAQMTNAHATTDRMVILLGLLMIAPNVLAPRVLPGHGQPQRTMMPIHQLNARTWEFVTEKLESASALTLMRVLLANVLLAQMNATCGVFASLKSNLPLKPGRPTPPHGMPSNKLDVFAILDIVVLIAHCKSAQPVLMS